jgi:hypothetical protein
LTVSAPGVLGDGGGGGGEVAEGMAAGYGKEMMGERGTVVGVTRVCGYIKEEETDAWLGLRAV